MKYSLFLIVFWSFCVFASDEAVAVDKDAVASAKSTGPKVQHAFSKIGKNGELMPDDAIEWYCVRDTKAGIHGLMWEVKQRSGIHNMEYKYTFDQGLDPWDDKSFISQVKKEKYCGYDDWRAPTKDELKELINDEHVPTIDPKFFPNTSEGGYWTGEDYPYNECCAWNIHFDEGLDYSGGKDYEYFVRLVRDVQPKDKFPLASAEVLKGQVALQTTAKVEPLVAKTSYRKVDAAGNVLPNDAAEWQCVDDTKTGLMWEAKQKAGAQNYVTKYTWDNAFNTSNDKSYVSLVNSFGLCGFKDWRGPTKEELLGLVNDAYTPMINTEFFFFTSLGGYWTEATYPEDPKHAWNVFFDFGFEGEDEKTNSYFVRLVRTGNAKEK